MKRCGLLIALVGFVLAGLPAAVLTPGLAYYRPGMKPPAETGSAVLDLRYVSDEASAAPSLAAVEAGQANPHRIILVLVSPETSAELRHQLVGIPRSLTIGRSAPELKSDIAVTTSAETDRRAFDALAAGTPPEKLLVENLNKTRYDEAALLRDHTGRLEAVQTPEPDPGAPATEPVPLAAPEGVDPVLQRAVHIYRGLSALKKL